MLTSEQERIYRDFEELISVGVAQIYRGACEIRNNQLKPPLAAMTVAHYLREVESALRAALTPYAPPGAKKACAAGHEASINTVLAVIGVEEDDRNIVAWRRFSNHGDSQHLTAYAHRNSLGATRPFDDAFEEACASFDALLTFVLGRVRASATRLTKDLRTRLAILKPTAEDVKKLRNNVPAVPFIFDRIFDEPLNPLWIDGLLSAGFFAAPPPGSATIVAMFAARLAATDPVRARSILQQLPAIDDAFMAQAYAESIRFFGDADQLLVSKMLNWVQSLASANSGFPRFPQFAALIRYLGVCGDTTSALAFVGVLTIVNPPTETTNPFFRAPKALLEPDEYNEIVLAGINALAMRAPIVLVNLFCDRLETALAVSFPNRTPSPSGSEDMSEEWLVTFNDPAANLYSLKHILAKRIADALIVAAESASAHAILMQLRTRSYRVFRRLEAHLLLHAPSSTAAADAMVTDPHNYWSIAPQTEFAELLRRRFPHLNDAQKQIVLDAVATDVDRAVINEDVTDEDYRELNERRIYNHLILLSGHLPDAYNERLLEVAARQRMSTHLAMSVTESPQIIGPESPWKTEEFRRFTPSELVAALSSRPLAQGAVQQVREVVETAPDQFDSVLDQLESLAPAYLRGIVLGFTSALQTAKAFDCPRVLTFCHRVLKRQAAHYIVAGDLGNDWSALRIEIANLITEAMNSKFVTFNKSNRETLLAIIDRILIDESPSHDEPTEPGGRLMRSRVDTHVAALRALVLVIHYFREPQHQRPLVERDGIRSQTDAAALLGRFLALSVTAVRVYAGECFDFFCEIDLPWARTAVALIFPMSELPDLGRRAVWETFITISSAKFHLYDELKEQYALAASTWPIEEARTGTPDFSYPNALARHFLTFYLHGRISLDDLAPLYARLSDKTAAHAMFRLGDDSATPDSGIGDEEIERFLAFWDWRKKEITNATASHIDELMSFGAWFCTLKLPERVGLDELKRVLALTGGAIKPTYRIVKCLGDVSNDGLASALECVLALVDGRAATNKYLYVWVDDLRNILLRASKTNEATVDIGRTIAGHLTVKQVRGFETSLCVQDLEPHYNSVECLNN